MNDKKYSQFTLNDKAQESVTGLLGRSEVKTRLVKTKNGDVLRTEFSIRVDLPRGADGNYSKEAKYLNASIVGDYKARLEALQKSDFPRIAVSGYFNAREEKVNPAGGVWPARLDFNAQRLYIELQKEADPEIKNEGW